MGESVVVWDGEREGNCCGFTENLKDTLAQRVSALPARPDTTQPGKLILFYCKATLTEFGKSENTNLPASVSQFSLV